jgi:hypothetical protein
MTYTNELEVEVDFSDVDPNLLDQSQETDQPVSVLSSTLMKIQRIEEVSSNDSGVINQI